MNATSDGERRSLHLIEIIDLKWQLAREGIRLHVEKLQDDPAYARRVLAQAGGSSSPALRGAAARMRALLGLADETP